MADYKYIGTTTYIKNNKENNEKLAVLANAIEVLSSNLKTREYDENKYQNLIQSDDYQFLYDNDSVCYAKVFELPENTPEAYQNAEIETINIKNVVPMLKIYLPSAAKNEDKLNQFNKAYIAVLEALFGTDVVSIKTKEAMEYDEFDAAKVNIIKAVQL